VLYGTGLSLVDYFGGAVFSLVPSASSGGAWTEYTVHEFTTAGDGNGPMAARRVQTTLRPVGESRLGMAAGTRRSAIRLSISRGMWRPAAPGSRHNSNGGTGEVITRAAAVSWPRTASHRASPVRTPAVADADSGRLAPECYSYFVGQ
jgi:hypothetical protein